MPSVSDKTKKFVGILKKSHIRKEQDPDPDPEPDP
jgi:hypothetical protein